MKKPRHHVPIRMTDEEHAALKYLAQRDKKRSASAWVRDAIAEAMQPEDDDSPDHVWTCPKHGAQRGPWCMACGSDPR